MKLYLDIKEMVLDGINHKIVNAVNNKKNSESDFELTLQKNDEFIKKTMQVDYKKDSDEIENVYFVIKEQDTWFSYPLYEIVDSEIIDFDYTQYTYFLDTERRNKVADKIGIAYSYSSENKIIRKTLKKILEHLKIEDDNFLKYNNKVESIIKKIPKGKK